MGDSVYDEVEIEDMEFSKVREKEARAEINSVHSMRVLIYCTFLHQIYACTHYIQERIFGIICGGTCVFTIGGTHFARAHTSVKLQNETDESAE